MSHSGDELGFIQKLNYLRVSQFMKNENKIYLKTWTKGNGINWDKQSCNNVLIRIVALDDKEQTITNYNPRSVALSII